MLPFSYRKTAVDHFVSYRTRRLAYRVWNGIPRRYELHPFRKTVTPSTTVSHGQAPQLPGAGPTVGSAEKPDSCFVLVQQLLPKKRKQEKSKHRRAECLKYCCMVVLAYFSASPLHCIFCALLLIFGGVHVDMWHWRHLSAIPQRHKHATRNKLLFILSVCIVLEFSSTVALALSIDRD